MSDENIPEEFFVDDFFVTDSGNGRIEIQVEMRGRQVPLLVKKGLGIREMEAAKQNAIKRRFLPNGQPEIVSMQDDVYAIELLARAIVSWPFVDRTTGQPFPVSRENIAKMFSDNSDAAVVAIVNFIKGKKAAQEPFLPDSGQTSEDPS